MAEVVDTVKKVLRRPTSLSTNPHQSTSSESCHGQDSVNHREGVLCRPWRRVHRKEEPDAVFLLVRPNYKVYINLAESHRSMQRFTSILDNKASPSFIHIDVLPPQLCKKVKPLTHHLKVRDVRGKLLQIFGTIRLVVSLGCKRTLVKFHVAEK